MKWCEAGRRRKIYTALLAGARIYAALFVGSGIYATLLALQAPKFAALFAARALNSALRSHYTCASLRCVDKILKFTAA